MKKKKLIKNKLLIKLLFTVVISFLLGIFYMAVLSKSNKDLIGKELNTFILSLNKISYNKAFISCISSNLLLTIFIWLLGISIIGIPIIILIIIFKAFILGFSISSILYFYHFKGIIIAIIYCLPLGIELFGYLFLSYYSIIFSKNLNQLLFFKREISFNRIMKRYSKILLFSGSLILLGSIIEIYIVPSILSILKI